MSTVNKKAIAIYTGVLKITEEANKKIKKPSDKEISEKIINLINGILEEE